MLNIDIGTVIFAMVNFALLVLLLRLFLYKPVLAMLDKRRQAIDEALDQADRTRMEADEAEQRLQQRIAEAHLQADQILTQAKAQAEADSAQALLEARAEARRITEAAAQSIALERERALEAVRQQAAELAILAAEKALTQPLTEQQQQRLLDSFVEQVGSRP